MGQKGVQPPRYRKVFSVTHDFRAVSSQQFSEWFIYAYAEDTVRWSFLIGKFLRKFGELGQTFIKTQQSILEFQKKFLNDCVYTLISLV